MKFRLYDYDVWGNEKDGFNVNDVFKTSTTVELNEKMSDRQIVNALKKEWVIKKGVQFRSIDIDGDFEYALYFDYKGRPEFELRREL